MKFIAVICTVISSIAHAAWVIQAIAVVTLVNALGFSWEFLPLKEKQ